MYRVNDCTANLSGMRLKALVRKSVIFALKHRLLRGHGGRQKNRVDTRAGNRDQKRIVVLSQFYRPEPAVFPPSIAEAFQRDGYQVSVVTGYPNRPDGKLYPTYRQRYKFSEKIGDVLVHRVPHIINYSRNSLGRIANFLTFSLSALTATAHVRGADSVYVYATPATAAIPAQIWKKLLGIPYVLHVQDLWPESVTDSGMMGRGTLNRLAAAAMSPWLKRLYGDASELIAISPGMKGLIIERGYTAETCSVIYNWAEETSITTKPRESFSGRGLRLLYAGTLGPMQDLETVVAAARKFENTQGFSLKIAGGGIMEDVLHKSAAGLSSTRFMGRISRSSVSELYIESDFQLVTLKDIPIFRTTVPSKLQASLASGVPVITTVKGDVADLIERYDAGIVAEPENIDALATAFKEALNMPAHVRARMGMNARKLYEEHMSRLAGTSSIISIMDRVSGRGSQQKDLDQTNTEMRHGSQIEANGGQETDD